VNHSTSRRSFLAGGAAALTPWSAAAAAAREYTRTEDLKLAVATYSLRKFSRDQTIDIMRSLGVKYANVKSFHMPYESTPKQLEEARAQFARAGIEIIAGGNVGLSKNDEADVRFHFEYAHNAGFPAMVCAPTHDNLGLVEKYAKKHNIKVAIHNHGPEDRYYPRPSDALKLIRNMDPIMGLCVDVGHTVRTGADILEEIEQAGSRIYDLHIKDLARFTDKDSQVAVGDGAMPVPAIFKLLKKMNYQGGVSLEYEVHADHPQTGMAKSFSYMRGVLDGQRG
jgi:sugar phosphate isomerase/epimerase